MRAVLVAVAALSFTRVAHAENIDIEIQVDPTMTQTEAGKQYRRGREADEMRRKGYICHREVGSSECFWAKPERIGSYWGECKQSTSGLKGRKCERVTPGGSGWYYDFERPLVLLAERIFAAQADGTDARNPAIIKLMAGFLRKAEGISKRLNDEQVARLNQHFGSLLNEARLIVPGQHGELVSGVKAKVPARPAADQELDDILRKSAESTGSEQSKSAAEGDVRQREPGGQ